MLVLVVIEAVVLAFLALLVAGLLRSHAEILRTLHDAGLGHDPLAEPGVSMPVAPPVLTRADAGSASIAVDISGSTPGGESVVIGVAGAAQPTLLAFLSSGCITCHQFWDSFAAPHLELPGGARLVIVTMGSEAESEAAIAKVAPPAVTVVMSSEAWNDYEVPGSPYFVFVDGESGRVVGEGTAPDWDQVLRLMNEAGDDGALEAGRAESTVRARRAERRKLDDRAREARADEILLAAGIHPGDPSLYATPEPPATDE
ncbi:MAG: TlpA family protein disulfide reductase [Acidimicrobiia bacterium]